jgi:hypothetical protein
LSVVTTNCRYRCHIVMQCRRINLQHRLTIYVSMGSHQRSQPLAVDNRSRVLATVIVLLSLPCSCMPKFIECAPCVCKYVQSIGLNHKRITNATMSIIYP